MLLLYLSHLNDEIVLLKWLLSKIALRPPYSNLNRWGGGGMKGFILFWGEGVGGRLKTVWTDGLPISPAPPIN